MIEKVTDLELTIVSCGLRLLGICTFAAFFVWALYHLWTALA